MGVLGLTPFLQKACPEVFKTLPHRLKSIAGKTLVIDGTLITQRLHFAPMPHPYRHVLGWYRIAQELKDADVKSICIFDGKGRSLAKQAELERRRENRRIVSVRGQLEEERLKRLCRLTAHVKAWRELSLPAQKSATQALKRLVEEPTAAGAALPSYMAGNLELDNISDIVESPQSTYMGVKPTFGDFRDADLSEVLEKFPHTLVGTPAEASTESALEETSLSNAATPRAKEFPTTASDAAYVFLNQLSLEDTDPSRLEEAYEVVDELPPETVSVVQPPEHLSVEDVKSTLASCYLEYKASISKLALLSEASPTDRSPSTKEDGSEARADYIMSKTQHQLTVDEGDFWQRLAESNSSDAVEPAVIALAEKSSVLSVSYERRTHPPTEETYEESVEILNAVGIPCIECDGPFEAEALAASLVLHGHADYVASEDTDVIVYGAPLIRNLTRRDEPLVVISGDDVRTTLHLDHKRFIDFALLLGTDFSQRIKNVGPQRALKFIREYGCIEKVLEHETQFPPRVPPNVYLEQVAEARTTFETLPPTPDMRLLQPLQYDEAATHKVLRRYGLGREIPVSDWDYTDALAGNYFQDNPSAS
ncbi:hypothetical protein NM688_g7024 [Phlebia brevispora]|uniref:Uncharacterized protein n=1 Tax=Phlebia brevispora TaxID=194682 RepID=A0ACC1S9U8_9APHY|nr:hypothetical protein NM688_g7024 [Phlebia brevispora]